MAPFVGTAQIRQGRRDGRSTGGVLGLGGADSASDSFPGGRCSLVLSSGDAAQPGECTENHTSIQWTTNFVMCELYLSKAMH